MYLKAEKMLNTSDYPDDIGTDQFEFSQIQTDLLEKFNAAFYDAQMKSNEDILDNFDESYFTNIEKYETEQNTVESPIFNFFVTPNEDEDTLKKNPSASSTTILFDYEEFAANFEEKLREKEFVSLEQLHNFNETIDNDFERRNSSDYETNVNYKTNLKEEFRIKESVSLERLHNFNEKKKINFERETHSDYKANTSYETNLKCETTLSCENTSAYKKSLSYENISSYENNNETVTHKENSLSFETPSSYKTLSFNEITSSNETALNCRTSFNYKTFSRNETVSINEITSSYRIPLSYNNSLSYKPSLSYETPPNYETSASNETISGNKTISCNESNSNYEMSSGKGFISSNGANENISSYKTPSSYDTVSSCETQSTTNNAPSEDFECEIRNTYPLKNTFSPFFVPLPFSTDKKEEDHSLDLDLSDVDIYDCLSESSFDLDSFTTDFDKIDENEDQLTPIKTTVKDNLEFVSFLRSVPDDSLDFLNFNEKEDNAFGHLIGCQDNNNSLGEFRESSNQVVMTQDECLILDSSAYCYEQDGKISYCEDGNYVPEQVLQCKWENCFLLYETQSSLVRHIEKSHVELKRGDEFTCFWQDCPRKNKPFNARYKLLIHMRVHSGEKPNKCLFRGCNKAFARLENLKIHQRSHTGERPYLCQFANCTKSFSNSSDRAKHQRTHFDTKPYACQISGCLKKYTDPSSLRKHVKNHSPEEQMQLKKKQGGNHKDATKIYPKLKRDEGIKKMRSNSFTTESRFFYATLDHNYSNTTLSSSIKRDLKNRLSEKMNRIKSSVF